MYLHKNMKMSVFYISQKLLVANTYNLISIKKGFLFAFNRAEINILYYLKKLFVIKDFQIKTWLLIWKLFSKGNIFDTAVKIVFVLC